MNQEQSSRHFNHALARLSQEELRDLVSNLAHQLRRLQVRRPQQVQHGQPMMPRMDIFDDPSSPMIIAHVEIPGMRKEDVTLQVHDSVLVVAGERKPAMGGEWLHTAPSTSTRPSSYPAASEGGAIPAFTPQSRFRVQELKYGKFKRLIDVPVGLDATEVTASMTDGMLLITWPREPAAVRNLAIDVD